NAASEKRFEIGAAAPEPRRQVGPRLKFVAAGKILMRVSVQRDGDPSRPDQFAQKADEHGIALEREHLTRMPVLWRNSGLFVADGERNHGETHRHATPDVAVDLLECLRRSEVAGVIVPQRYFHGPSPPAKFFDTHRAAAARSFATKTPPLPACGCRLPPRARRWDAADRTPARSPAQRR